MSQQKRTLQLKPSRRRQLSRIGRDRRRQRNLVILGIVGILLILTIPAIGYYTAFVGPPRRVVVQVNDKKFTLGFLVKLLRGYQRTGQQLDMGSAPFNLVQTLMENELIRQAAPRNSIVLTEEEIDQDVRKTFLGEVKPEDPRTPEQREREFRERYRQFLNNSDFSEKEHRELVAYSLYRQRMEESLSSEVPTVAPHYHLYALTVDSESKMNEARTFYEQGISFADLVAKFSTDEEAIRKGGELGWWPQGLNSRLDDLVKNLQLNQLSEITRNPVSPGPGQPTGRVDYTVFMVAERAEARELEEENRRRFKELALQKWLSDEQAKNVVVTNFSSDRYTWVVQQLGKSQTAGGAQ
ncbi:MAG: SurA N-terminal domain-containing protein [Chloroflexi bacterium]|nr:SurA N-terminal domain-containing protein [Chloroflexota bacterium]